MHACTHTDLAKTKLLCVEATSDFALTHFMEIETLKVVVDWAWFLQTSKKKETTQASKTERKETGLRCTVEEARKTTTTTREDSNKKLPPKFFFRRQWLLRRTEENRAGSKPHSREGIAAGTDFPWLKIDGDTPQRMTSSCARSANFPTCLEAGGYAEAEAACGCLFEPASRSSRRLLLSVTLLL